MRSTLLLLPGFCLFASFARAEEKPRQTLTFPPGAKAPEGTTAKASPAPKVPAAITAPTATPAGSPAAPTAALDEPARIALIFFELLGKNRVEDAYSKLTQGSQIAARPEELRTLKAKTNEAIQVFGDIRGSEQVEEKAVGQNLLRRTYISLGREFPLRWRFYFYRSDKTWRLVDLRVDDRLIGLFDEKDEKDPAAETKQP